MNSFSSKKFLTFYPCFTTKCFSTFFVKKRLSHFKHVTAHNASSLSFSSKRFSHLLQFPLHGTAHDVGWISFSSKNVSRIYCTFVFTLNCIDLSFLSGQGLPLTSDNVKYWCLVRYPLWFTSSSLPLQVYLFSPYLMNLQFMGTLKSLLTTIQHMHWILVFRKMSSMIHIDFSSLAGIIVLVTKWWHYSSWKR